MASDNKKLVQVIKEAVKKANTLPFPIVDYVPPSCPQIVINPTLDGVNVTTPMGPRSLSPGVINNSNN